MKKRGISLIVLVITIIVIVILGTAAIVTFVKNNPIENAKNATKKWNKKTLEEKSNMLESELLLEFQEAGLGGMVLPSYAKEAYMDALKEGKTEEEAKQIAMDSFIGSYYNWDFSDYPEGSPYEDYIYGWFNELNYTPMYLEVKRVVDLLDSSVDGNVELNIDKSIVPEDLVDSIEAYKEFTIEYCKGNKTDAEWDEFYVSNEPLYSFIEKNPDGKYFDQIVPTVKFPYYIYTSHRKDKIVKMNEYKNNYPTKPYYVQFSEITTLIVDENYTSLSNVVLPPVGEVCNIVLPETLKSIGKNVFSRSGVKKLVIPSSVESIEEGAFGTRSGAYRHLTELVIKKEKGSIPGEPWGLDPTKTTIKWEP